VLTKKKNYFCVKQQGSRTQHFIIEEMSKLTQTMSEHSGCMSSRLCLSARCFLCTATDLVNY